MFEHRFRVATSQTGHRRQVQVLIYSDRQELAAAHAAHRGIPVHEDTAGGVAFRGGWWWPKPDPYPIVVMRLWTEQLTTRTIAHESTHAAAMFFLTDNVTGWNSRARTYLLGDHEPLAYAIGDLTGQITARLIRAGYQVRP